MKRIGRAPLSLCDDHVIDVTNGQYVISRTFCRSHTRLEIRLRHVQLQIHNQEIKLRKHSKNYEEVGRERKQVTSANAKYHDMKIIFRQKDISHSLLLPPLNVLLRDKLQLCVFFNPITSGGKIKHTVLRYRCSDKSTHCNGSHRFRTRRPLHFSDWEGRDGGITQIPVRPCSNFSSHAVVTVHSVHGQYLSFTLIHVKSRMCLNLCRISVVNPSVANNNIFEKIQLSSKLPVERKAIFAHVVPPPPPRAQESIIQPTHHETTP